MKTNFVTARTSTTAMEKLRRIASATREKQYVILERVLDQELKKVTPKESVQ